MIDIDLVFLPASTVKFSNALTVGSPEIPIKNGDEVGETFGMTNGSQVSEDKVKKV
jgi:hypothetical protein